MPRLALEAAGLREEIASFEQRLRHGLGVLRRVEDARPGATSRECVFEIEGVRLYHYGDAPPRPDAVPLLIVYALVNRPDMADLQAGRSLVAALMARGFDVYLVDWGYPGGADRLLGLEDYVCRYLDACVEHLRRALARPALPLLGICQGGTLSLCYAALEPHKVEKLITTVTPVDFQTAEDMLSHLVRGVDVARLVRAHGNPSGDLLNGLFLSLKPFRLTQQKYLRFLEQIDSPEAVATFLRMEHWIFDSPALAGRACVQFAEEFYQRNRLVRGGLVLGGREVSLARVTMPVLNLFARDDHLVPPAASRALGAVVGTRDYTEAELPGGHIGVYVGLKSKLSVPAVVAEWMAARD